MKSRILSGIVVSAILTIASGAAFPARAAFSHKVAKVVVGYDANRSTLANFPVLVRVPTATASECRADGADIRFTSADGETVYPHEIDAWNPSGESTVWVLLPEMKNGTMFVMEWGDADYTGPETPLAKGAVWDPAGYAGVWHMTEASGNVANATSKTGVNGVSLDAVPSGALKANSARHTANDAPIGYARFTGARQDSSDHYRSRAYLKVADYSNLELGGNFMISGWYYMAEYKNGSEDWNSTTRNGRIFSRKTQWDSSGGFDLGLNDSSDTRFFMRGSAKEPFAQFTDTPSAKQKWVHVAFVYDGASVTAFFNGGATKKSGTATAATDVALPLGIGSNVNAAENNDKYIAGSFDEVRLMKTVSGNSYDDWIAAEYAMGADTAFLEDQAISQTTPVVSVSITSNTAREWWNESQTITVSRSSDSAWSAISVNMEYSGSASLIAGLPATVEMAAGETSVTMVISVEDNDLTDGDKTLTATILPGTGYDVGASSSVALTVLDDETHAQVCSWTGSGDGTLWHDGYNWSSHAVPTEIDTVVFGGDVSGDVSVTFAEGEPIEAKAVRFATSHAVTLGTGEGPIMPAIDFDVGEGAGTVSVEAESVFSTSTVIRAASGTQVVFTKVSGEGDLTVEGAGTVNLGSQQGNRLGGETRVVGGTLLVSNHRQLGALLVVGGGDTPAIARTNGLWGDINPFGKPGCRTEILQNGSCDLATDKQSGSWSKEGTGPIFIHAGGSMSQGNRRFEFNSAGVTNLFLEGSFEGSATASIDLKDNSWLVRPATASGALTITSPITVYPSVKMLVEDVPGVDVDLTISGSIGYGWHPHDGFRKDGMGVLRLTGANTYGGLGTLADEQGATVISQGTLLVDNESGSGTGNSLVHVKGGAVLGGTGRIGGLIDPINHWSSSYGQPKGTGEHTCVKAAGTVEKQAVVWPGTIDGEDGSHVNGTLTVGVADLRHPVTFGDYSTLRIGIGEKTSDALVVNGAVDISATGTRLELAAVGELAKIHGGQFTILSATDGITGDFSVIDASKSSWHVTKVNARQVEREGDTVEVYDAIVASIPQRGLSVIIR